MATAVGGFDQGVDRALAVINDYRHRDQHVLNAAYHLRESASDHLARIVEYLYEIEVRGYYSDLERHFVNRFQRAVQRHRKGTTQWRVHTVIPLTVNDVGDSVTDPDDFLPEANAVTEDVFDAYIELSTFGITKPTPLLCLYTRSHRETVYPFVECDRMLICTCGDKHDSDDCPLCFHELMGLLVISTDEIIPDGPEVSLPFVTPEGV